MSVSKARLHKARVSRELTTKNKTSIITVEPEEDLLANLAIEYEMTNQRIKILQARMQKQLRPAIEEELRRRGVEDISGHKHIDYGEVEMIHERHASIVFNEIAAETILAKKGLLEVVSHEETKRILDEEKIVEAYESGLLTPKEFDKMFSESVSWHFKVKVDATQNPEYNSLIGMRKQIESGAILAEMPEIESSDG